MPTYCRLITIAMSWFILSYLCAALPFSTVDINHPKYIFRREPGVIAPSCKDKHKDIFDLAVKEAGDMAQAASDKLEVLAAWLEDPKQTKTAAVKTVQKMWQTVFGTVYWANKDGNRKNPQGKKRVAAAKSFFDSIKGVLSNFENIDVYCDEDWLLEEAPKEAKAGPKDGWSKWDARTYHNPTPGWRKLDRTEQGVVKGPGWCSDDERVGDPGMQAVIWASGKEYSIAPVDVLVICPNWLDKWAQNTISIAPAKEKTYNDEEQHLQYFMGGAEAAFGGPGAPGFVILHEITHSFATFQEKETTDDNGYTWKEITKIGRDAAPKSAFAIPAKTANCYAFFAAAMYLDKNSWDTGFSKKLQTD